MSMIGALVLALLVPTSQDVGLSVPPAPPPAEASGTIIFYRRGAVIGAAIACPIRHQGNEVVELGRSRVFEWKVTPGRYVLENKNASVEVTVEAGETRYVRCQIKSGFLSGRADLQTVDGTEYNEVKGDLQPASAAD